MHIICFDCMRVVNQDWCSLPKKISNVFFLCILQIPDLEDDMGDPMTRNTEMYVEGSSSTQQ